MNNSYKHIVFLFLRNKPFLVLLSSLILSALLSKVLFIAGLYFYAEQVFTLMFISGLWCVFHLGVILKQQFAHHRASLVPNFRIVHISALAGVYLLLMVVGYCWEFSFRPVIFATPQGLWGIYASCLLMALIFTYLGYLSIGRVLIYAYVLLLLFAYLSVNVIFLLNNSSYLVWLVVAGCVLFAAFLYSLLVSLKEESFEYQYIFSWPPKSLVVNQIRAGHSISNFFDSRKPGGLQHLPLRISKYYQLRGEFAQAYHWYRTERINYQKIWIVILLIMPLVLLVIKNLPVFENLAKGVYGNFLLLSMTPVLITLGACYRRMAYWGYDVLKPVDKKKYFYHQAIVLINSLVLYWMLFVVFLVIIPNIFWQPQLLLEERFWAYITLTFSFSFAVLCWIALISCQKNSLVVILQGLFVCAMALGCFYFSSSLNLDEMYVLILLIVICGVTIGYKAHQSWLEKEYE